MSIYTNFATMQIMRNTPNGGGSSSGNENKPKRSSRLIVILILFAVTIASTLGVAFVKSRDNVQGVAIEMEIHKQKASKGDVYDVGYVNIEYSDGSTQWREFRMESYKNIEIGSIVEYTVVNSMYALDFILAVIAILSFSSMFAFIMIDFE